MSSLAVSAPLGAAGVPSPERAARSKFNLTYEVKVLIAALFIAIILGVAFFLQPKSKRQLERFCTTTGCEEHRRRLENQLDQSVDPCDDFYAYVCGRWEPRKEFHLSRSELSDMFLSWLYKLPATLEKGVVQFPVGKKVAAMFERCRTQKGSQVGIIKGFMRSRGIVWPESPEEPVPPAKALFDLSFNWNVHLWFTLKVLPAIPTKMPRRIFLAPNQLMLLWKAMINQIPKQSFQRVYTDLFKIFADDKSRKPETNDAFQTHDILEYVYDTLVPSCPCKSHTPGLFSLSDIDKSSPIPIGEHIMNISNEVLGIYPPFTMDDLVLVSDMSHFDNILRIFGRVNDTTLLRHLAFLFAQVYAVVAYPTGVLVVVHGSEHRAEEERPRFCAGQIEPSYKLLVAAMTSVAHFSEQERRRIDEQLEGIVQVAVDKTWAVSWLDNKTKQVATQKLKNVRTVVWPSDKFLTPEVLEEVYADFNGSASSFADFWIDTRRSQRLLFGSEAAEQELLLGDNTRLPYVEYIRVLNRLSVSLGALAAPLYYPQGTKAMLHGGVLFLYARALISAIDNEGVVINPQGEIVSSWLNEDLQETYEQRTLGCLPGNVSIFPEIPAMEVAYEAFKRSFEDNDTQLSEDLTEEKVFFITACLSTCATTPADNLYGGDCNKAVVNFEPFARAFNCPVGSKMNPATKCSFYD
ncbi:uncharacterized protein LOC119449079 [Dermacentor silvarum]|uniref:uncharacterized protein LOC119449079 n=1 Tax=Dermacentor silvarum TaxID=543639 RepID=UPI001898C142|nr:uncharacterized protein LOC119449079 [Dermacentor silvarum]